MKKVLLSIMTSALLVVGCQDYDDQFSSLESQISALATTVAGLSQVQSDLASLAGTVSSLASTVNGLGDTIDTAVSDGLADIQSDIDAIETAVADVASSEEVSSLATAVDAAQDDLTDLLAASSVFTGNVVVTSESTLDAYLAMGPALNIVNGNVDITVTTAMTQTKVQELVNNMLTIVGDLTYTSGAATIAETTFDNLTGVQSITLTQGGGASFKTLASANVIRLNDNFESGTNPVNIIHFGELTTVTAFRTDNNDATIEFLKATELHLTKLARYGSSSLTLKIDEGGTLLIPVLASKDADGLETTLDLTVEGASSLDFSLITDGDISATDVANVTGGADHDGTVTLDGVTKAVIPNFTRGLTITGTNDLDYLHVIGALPAVATGATAVTTTPALDLTGQTGLATVIIDGTLGDVTLSGNTNLTTVTYSANAEALSVTGASDLTALTLAGTAKSISVTSNSDLETLAITTELNALKGNATAVSTSGSLVVTGNTDLVSIASAYDPVKTMTITGNTKLTSVDLTGTALVGAATDKASVNISGNALNATKIVDQYAATEVGVGAGTISDESKLTTMKTYLTAAVAAATSVVVKLDTVDLVLTKGATAAADTEAADQTDWAVIDFVPAVTTGNSDAAKGKYATQIAPGQQIEMTHTHPTTAVTTLITPVASTPITLNANPTLAAAQILSDANGYVANAASAGVTLNAYVGGSSSIAIAFLANNSSATNESGNEATGLYAGTPSNTAVAATHIVGITVDGLTATAVAGGALGTAALVASKIDAIWTAAYGTTASTYTGFDVDGDTTSGTITVSGDVAGGSRYDGKTVSIILENGTGADSGTAPIAGYKIGDLKTTADNKTASTKLIITAESVNEGIDYNTIQAGAFVMSFTAASGASTLTVASTYTGAQSFDVYRDDAFSDVTTVLDLNAGTSTTATTRNYLPWVA
jgi:hypothetical protein